MNTKLAKYNVMCIECQHVKAKHQHPTRLLQPIPIPECKWEVISMDFITILPIKNKKHDLMMVAIAKLTKGAHFIPLKYTYKAINIA
jgi:hypothetical protein